MHRKSYPLSPSFILFDTPLVMSTRRIPTLCDSERNRNIGQCFVEWDWCMMYMYSCVCMSLSSRIDHLYILVYIVVVPDISSSTCLLDPADFMTVFVLVIVNTGIIRNIRWSVSITQGYLYRTPIQNPPILSSKLDRSIIDFDLTHSSNRYSGQSRNLDPT